MIALVPRHGTKNPIFGVLAHGLFRFATGITKNVPSKTKTPQSVRQTSDLKRVTSHCWWMFYRRLIPSHVRMVPFVIQQKDFVLY